MSEVGGNPPGGSPESSLEHVTATRRLLRRLRGIMAGSGSAQERLDVKVSEYPTHAASKPVAATGAS